MNDWQRIPFVDAVWYKDGEIIITGRPCESHPELEHLHNCDEMGCGQLHVLAVAHVTQDGIGLERMTEMNKEGE